MCIPLSEIEPLMDTSTASELICQASIIEKNPNLRSQLTSLFNWRETRGQGKKSKAKSTKFRQIQKALKDESEILTEHFYSITAQQPGFAPDTGGALADMTDCNALAHVHESLDWLSMKMAKVMSRLQILEDDEANTLETIATLRNHFQTIAESCLLVLHLDLRVRCFSLVDHMVKSNDFFIEQNNYNPYAQVKEGNTDKEAELLSRQLEDLSERLNTSLQPHKFKYIFNGLGPVISNVLIENCKFIKKVNVQGVKRICRNIFSIQQKLTNITLTREADLDSCREFYELLYSKPTEFISLIEENGLKYASGKQYLAGFDLLHRGEDVDTNKFSMLRNKLQEIIDKDEAKFERGRKLEEQESLDIYDK